MSSKTKQHVKYTPISKFGQLVERISVTFCCNCAKNGKGANSVTNEADTIQLGGGGGGKVNRWGVPFGS